jgi:phospholipase/carboxylesterase
MLPHITKETGANPKHSIIWLHGLGADGNDFVPIVDELELPVPVRYIFPHAPERPVTINGGHIMRAWYDIAGTDISAKQDELGIRASQKEIELLIAQEIGRGIEAQHIFLAGFSQGGAIALHTALRQTAPLGGVLALSTYLPLTTLFNKEAIEATKQTPIFMAHGQDDSVVPHTLGINSREILTKSGYAVTWHEYPMQHSVCTEELNDISIWLKSKIY